MTPDIVEVVAIVTCQDNKDLLRDQGAPGWIIPQFGGYRPRNTRVTGSVAGDERRFITLADYPYRPEERLALSLGPVELGARVAMVPKQATGLVNRPFEQVPEDGVLRCYTPSAETDFQTGDSWLLALSPSRTLTIERIVHGASPSPCDDDPASWAFTGAALTFVR